MMNIDDLAKILRDDENYTGDTEQAKALITKLMVSTAEPKTVKEEEPITLKSFKVDERVEVLHRGDWTPGFVSMIARGSGNLHVHTERGPVTIGSAHMIRKLGQ